MGVMISMTLVFIYGGLLLLFGSAFMGAHASVSYNFDQPQSNHFYPKYLKVVSRRKSTPPPPPPAGNLQHHYGVPSKNKPPYYKPKPPIFMPRPTLQPPPPPASSRLESSPLLPV
ncbi:hypothetical protein I3843_16G034300 [Carya illinoinensis]|uniref:Uncharacterized protein n=1 Tax=Carya illinoinensis TaxID=32201 RepID=A0A8T1N3N7_CARIL|nr:formin-like protein 13 [Carya illinoinensis]KAG2663505.1 hypothetical protein I3760_16G032800 [Carya illinoinensis]KAG6624512.1 hypothetical protein CIPAW_16G031800 [Carya illinoinensis]KAG6671960.1 hypothetical protein I3842_16G031100 [Carya illinoinensis]KAG7941321.1 hypothetical protein I3843_16G034300 [Carya illinoinensis]